MKVTTAFAPVTAELKQQLNEALKSVLSEDDHDAFVRQESIYEKLGYKNLDAIYLFAEVTVEGELEIEELIPRCVVDQEGWSSYYDEPDMEIEPVRIPLKVISPQTPFSVAGKSSFLVVLQAESNLWDSCKDLPSWVWNQRCFDFMLRVSLKTKTGELHNGSTAGQIIRW